MTPGVQAWFLVGPTACGKTAVAHWLACRHGYEILSADAMLVYRGMDIGTAKPTPSERAGIRYHGIDLVEPDQSFSVGQYLEQARTVFEDCARRGARLLVTGGTGLYVQALRQGLDSAPPDEGARRKVWSARLADEGLEALRAEAELLCPGILARMPDSLNPRRVIRVMERLGQGLNPLPRTFESSSACTGPPMAALHFEPGVLAARIERRVDLMFADGLLEEIRNLRQRSSEWSSTASSAIGYAEGLAVLAGGMTTAEARDRIAIRTRQLAKRQRTWYRHRTSVAWIGGPTGPADVERAAEEVSAHWRTHGPHSVLGIADLPPPDRS